MRARRSLDVKRLIGRVAAAGSCLTVLGCATQGAPSGLVVRDVTVISAERAAPLEHAHVRIVDGRVAAVSERRLRGEQEIDGAGRYLIPGMIDSHVHLRTDLTAGMTSQQIAAHPDIVAAANAQEPRSYLFYGFTTVVDLFGDAERTARWNGLDQRPDAYFCRGAPLANGYPMNYLPEAARFDAFDTFLYDERQADRIPASVDPARHTPEAVAERIADDGAICVKVAYETGFGPVRGLPTPTVEMVERLTAAAHARGLPVFLHANSKDGQAFAVAAGVDAVAHGMWNGHTGDLDDVARDTLAAIDRDDIGYQPTIQVLFGEAEVLNDEYLARPELADAYPPALLDWYAGEEGRWYADQMRADRGAVDAAAASGWIIGLMSQVVGVLAEADARLLFGSDTPSGPTYANPPGLNGRLEMNNWIATGVSEEKLFRALTLDNARALGLESEIGTVEPGKAANLLLLGASPLESVEAYDTIETVFLHGRPIARETLSARYAPSEQRPSLTP